MRVAVGVDKDLKIVVVIDHLVMLLDVCPDVRIGKFRTDVEVLFIPKHLHLSLIAWRRKSLAADIDKGVGGLGVLPRRLVELAIHLDRIGRPVTDVMVGHRQKTCVFLGNRLGLSCYGHGAQSQD